jgi:quinol monooxygenase YgiN
MAYVVAATYRCKQGEEERIRELLELMGPPSRQEPACLFYQAHRSPDDPRVFFLYEQYEDEAGYEAHQATEHFARYIKDDAIPRLETRERAFYRTMD